MKLYKAELEKIMPKIWTISTVGDSCEIHDNLRFPINSQDRKKISGTYPYYGPTKALDYINEYKLNGTYALIGEDGDHFLKYKEKDMTLLVSGKFNVNNHAHVIKGSKKCLTEWFYWFFKRSNLVPYLSRQGAGRYKLTKEELKKLPIALPSLTEQKYITETLNTWDKAITQTQQLIEAKQKLKRGLMQQLLTGKARFPEYVQTNETIKTTFYTYSKDWSHVRISDIAWEIAERNTEGEDLTVLSCSKYDGFVNSLAYFGKKVYSDDTSNYKVIQKSQFGFPSNHIEEGSIGLLRHIDKGIVSPIYTIFEVDQSKVTPEFLYLLLKTDTYRHIFSSRTSASVDRRGSLRWKEFSKIRVPLPQLEEQGKFVQLFHLIDNEISQLKTKLKHFEIQKQGLMQVLLTGKIRVNGEGN